MGIMERMATAPISWGICEVPGWGVQLPVDRVLSEMSQLGFPATELGSEGYLPSDPSELRSLLSSHDLSLLAAFVPLVLHDEAEAQRTLDDTIAMAELLKASGATYFNTAPVTTWDWAERTPLTDQQWAHVMMMFDRIDELIAPYGLTQVLHMHVGTIVETRDEVARVIKDSPVKFVLDTAHLAVGGYDPAEFVRDAGVARVGLVHIKDADLATSARLNDGDVTLMEAVQQGIFPPVGEGDLPIEEVITTLESGGYQGWYVLEQDVAITGSLPADGEGPIANMRLSMQYLQGVDERLTA